MARKKITRREVMEAHDAWAMASTRYGENDMTTTRAYIRYTAAKDQYNADHGREFQLTLRRAKK